MRRRRIRGRRQALLTVVHRLRDLRPGSLIHQWLYEANRNQLRHLIATQIVRQDLGSSQSRRSTTRTYSRLQRLLQMILPDQAAQDSRGAKPPYETRCRCLVVPATRQRASHESPVIRSASSLIAQ